MPEQGFTSRPGRPGTSIGLAAVLLGLGMMTHGLVGPRSAIAEFGPDAANARSEPGRGAAQTGLASVPSPFTTLLPLLESTDRQRFAGQRVQIHGVRVQQVVGASILLVGPTAGETLAVRSVGRVRGLAAGNIVRLEGTVRLVPPSLDGWAFDAVERHALATRQVFIDADVLQPAPPVQRW